MPHITQHQLAGHIKPLKRVYFVFGEEILFLNEAIDTIKRAALSQGFDQQQRFFIKRGFDFGEMFEAVQSFGLFAEKTFIHASLDEVKTIDASMREKLLSVIAELHEDTVLLISKTQKADKKLSNSALANKVAEEGICLPLYALPERQFKRWLSGRGKQEGLVFDDDSLSFLAFMTEGNLLAAAQEISKLAILFRASDDQTSSAISVEALRSAVADNAKHSIFDIGQAWLSGDAKRCLTIIARLREEGTQAASLVWTIMKDMGQLASILEAKENGQNLASAMRAANIWKSQEAFFKQAGDRLNLASLGLAQRQLAAFELASKGMAQLEAYSLLKDILLQLCGHPAKSNKTAVSELKAV